MAIILRLNLWTFFWVWGYDFFSKPEILDFIGGPNGVRTRVFGVRGQRPRPLDDGTINDW